MKHPSTIDGLTFDPVWEHTGPLPLESSTGSGSRLRVKTSGTSSQSERRLGPYRLLWEVGRGGMAQVFLAQDPGGNRVALKALDPPSSENAEEDLARLHREADLLREINHPNVVGVRGFGIDAASGRGYLALEYVEGLDLEARILELGLERPDTLYVLHEVALGLRALHQAGVVHRDVKPSNVLLTADREVKLVDLGIALERGQSRLTRSGEVLGTPDYIAPEIARGHEPTPAADLYAWAAMAYRLLAGKQLFEHDSALARIHAHVKDTPPSFTELEPALPEALAALLDGCLAKDPVQRPAIGELIAALASQGADAPPRQRESFDAVPVPSPGAEPETPGGDSERFHHFVLLNEIGRGAHGVVHEAYHLDTHELVALKTLRDERPNPRVVERFQRESELLQSIQHPNTVKFLEAGVHEGTPYLALELVDGQGFDELIRDQELSLLEKVRVLSKLSEAVHAVHEAGVVHRDLKPGNVLVETGEPKLLDFGLSRDVDHTAGLTGTSDVLGTLCYMAPEQAKGKSSTVDRRADVYSLGAMLYEVLTGQPPHTGDAREVLLRVATEDPLAPSQVVADLPSELEAICLRALSKSPDERQESAALLAQGLRTWCETQGAAE